MIHETARSTDKQVELDESFADNLNEKLKRISEKVSELPLVDRAAQFQPFRAISEIYDMARYQEK